MKIRKTIKSRSKIKSTISASYWSIPLNNYLDCTRSAVRH
jgi:hypothetical protein